MNFHRKAVIIIIVTSAGSNRQLLMERHLALNSDLNSLVYLLLDATTSRYVIAQYLFAGGPKT